MIELRWKKTSDLSNSVNLGYDKSGDIIFGVLQYREGEDVIDMQVGVKTKWGEWQNVEIVDEPTS